MAYKFNPFTGNFDLTNEDVKNFSIKKVLEAEEIPSNQQMRVSGSISVNAQLSIKGELIIDSPKNSKPRQEIERTGFARVNESELFYLNSLRLLGHIKMKGQIRIGSPLHDSTPPFFIDTFEQYRINKNRRALVSGEMKIHGSLKLKGQLKIT